MAIQRPAFNAAQVFRLFEAKTEMKCKFSTFLLIALIGAMALLTSACSKSTSNGSATKNVVKNSTFKLTSPSADRYENVEGTALYSAAPDITERLAALGGKAPEGIKAFFILLNPKTPSEAILVKAPSDIPEEVYKNQSSSVIVVTGNVKSVDCQPLAAYIKESLGVNLALTASGELAYIDAETPINFSISNVSKSDAAAQRAGKTVNLPLEGTPLGQPKDTSIKTGVVTEDTPSQDSEEPQPTDSISTAAEAAQNYSDGSANSSGAASSVEAMNDVPSAMPTPHNQDGTPNEYSVEPTPAF